MLLSAPVFELKALCIFFSSGFSSHYFSSMLYRLFLLAVLLSLPVHALALALGDVVVRSTLGQVLDADIDMVVLSAQEAESLSVRLAPAEMFAEAGLDYGLIARSVRFSIEKKAGRTQVHLSSDKAITEPF